MTKRILFIENPCYLNVTNKQFTIKNLLSQKISTIPIEDIDVVLLDNQQITITNPLIQECYKQNIALISCDEKHMPLGITIPFDGNSLQHERLELQISTSQKLKDKIWKQIIISKINNQANVFKILNKEHKFLINCFNKVQTADKTNREAIASAYYWKNIFKPKINNFIRDKNGLYPNDLLNYGYSILRSIITKNIVSTGLNPSLGIFHKNKFNVFCLSDDLIEPFRPFIDNIVYDIINESENENSKFLNRKNKEKLIKVVTTKVLFKEQNMTLGQCVQNVVNDFLLVLKKEKDVLLFPKLINE